ncbi:MAG: tRNA lysidine(34) synthetase TilS [Aridibacter sp.]
MQKFVRSLLTEWRYLDLPFSDKTIILAVSGGADSVSLTLALEDLVKRKKLSNKFIIAHFNHKLRGKESDADEEFVRDLGVKTGFEFVSGCVEDKIKKGQNLEQWARVERYNFLLNTAKENDSKIVLTAHTINDQVETFLLNLIRGSGSDGLSGMKPIRKLQNSDKILLVRPFLNWAEREEVIKFLEINKIKYRNDAMNDDLNYQRVRIRKELIPDLKNYNPQIVFTLANSAKLITQDTELLDELAKEKIDNNNLINNSFLEIKKLKSCSKAMLYKVLRIWLKANRGDLKRMNLKNIEAIERLINSRRSGKIIELPNLGRVTKEDGRLFFKETKVEKWDADNYN